MKMNLKVILGLSLLSFTASGAMALEDEKSNAEKEFNSAITGGVAVSEENVTAPVTTESHTIIDSIIDYFDLNKRVKNTKFDTLEMLFNAGRRPIANEVTGWFSGVTFSNANPDTPLGTILIGKAIITGGEATGPLFQKEEIAFKIDFSNNPGEYENLPQDEIDRYSRGARYIANINSKGMVFTVMGQINYQVRKYDEYLIVKHTNKYSPDYVSYSYYFKNVTPVRTEKPRRNTFSVRDMSLGTSMSEAHY